jgi:hypothetical protein
MTVYEFIALNNDENLGLYVYKDFYGEAVAKIHHANKWWDIPTEILNAKVEGFESHTKSFYNVTIK